MAKENLVSADLLEKSYGLKTLLDGVSLGIGAGDRIGVVGLNGGGKSTLIRLLAGKDEPDGGRVSRNRDLRFELVGQNTHLAGDTVGAAILEPLGLEVYEWASNPRARAVLTGLGIDELGLDTPVTGLSGGERRRVALAATLVKDLDLVLLDEPTNHLDVEGVEWLAKHLLSRRCAVVVVTHDRWFLDTVATHTWEVHDGTVDVYEGGYNDWVFARAERQRQAEAAEQRRRNLARKELAWLRRGPQARTSKPRYRVEAAEAIIKDVPPVRDSVELMKFSERRLGKKVIDLIDATVATPDGRPLVTDLTWRLAPGERVGLVGVNGSGKTTLLRALAGDDVLTAGRREQGLTVKLGWLRQELDDLDVDRRVLDSVEDVATYTHIGNKEISASQLAERLGFSRKRQRTFIRDLSGGERRRLQLTRVLMSEPNVLLLDEPTNDLDIDTLQELESLLDGWPGTLVVISHDRYLIERICDSAYALFGDGRLTHLPGGIAEYLERRAAQEEGSSGANDVSALTADAGAKSTVPAQENAAVGEREPSGGGQRDRELQKEMRSLERKMSRVEQRIDKLEKELADAAEAVDTDAMTKLSTQLSEAKDEYDELETSWLEAAEEREG